MTDTRNHSAARTAIGSFGGALSGMPSGELATHAARAAWAIAKRRLKDLITAVEIGGKKGSVTFNADAPPKATSLKAPAGLKPVFQ